MFAHELSRGVFLYSVIDPRTLFPIQSQHACEYAERDTNEPAATGDDAEQRKNQDDDRPDVFETWRRHEVHSRKDAYANDDSENPYQSDAQSKRECRLCCGLKSEERRDLPVYEEDNPLSYNQHRSNYRKYNGDRHPKAWVHATSNPRQALNDQRSDECVSKGNFRISKNLSVLP